MDKSQNDLLRMTARITLIQSEIASAEKRISSASTQITIGLLGTILGLFLTAGGYLVIGIVLILAGLLAAMTNASRRSQSRAALDEYKAQLKGLSEIIGNGGE